MKLATIFLIASIVHVSAASMAQQVTLKKDNLSYKQLFKEIRKQTGYSILWEADKFNANEKISVNFFNASLKKVFDDILNDKGFPYLIEETTIIIQNPSQEKSKNSSIEKNLAIVDVSGKVVDENGAPLGGANVVVKTSKKGINAKTDGTFTIIGIEEGTTLVVSFLGYEPKEIRAAKELGIVRLAPATNKLDQVQIQAYTRTSRRLSTANISSVGKDEIEKQPINNPILALQGRVTGVEISQVNGAAGSTVKVKIQGTNSLRGGTDPFYVVDGVPFNSALLRTGQNTAVWGEPDGAITSFSRVENLSTPGAGSPLAYLNPNDIESIEVLKDADATAIYGSRAANGAIIITTKRGGMGPLSVSLNLRSGSNKIVRRVELANTDQLLAAKWEGIRNGNINTATTNSFRTAYAINGTWDPNANTDWQEEFLGKSVYNGNAQLDVSGGTSTTNYRIGLGYNRQTAIFSQGNANRSVSLSTAFNTASLNQRLKLQLSVNYLTNRNRLPAISINELLLRRDPNAPALLNSDGSINWGPVGPTGVSSNKINNPIALLANHFGVDVTNLSGNIGLSYNVLDGLDIKVSGGYNMMRSDLLTTSTLAQFAPEDRANNRRSGLFGLNSGNSFSVEPQIGYRKQFGIHKLNLLIGGSLQQSLSNGKELQISGQPSDNLIVNASAGIPGFITQIANEYKYNAIFARSEYNYADKYLLNLTVRNDASSRFGPDNSTHAFWSIGTGWIFSEETWFKEHVGFLSFGKFKGSYGTTGSDQIGDYTFMDLFDISREVEVPYHNIGSLTILGLTNNKLQWELTKKINLGIELGLLKDRLNISLNYAINKSSNLLQQTVLPSIVGFNNVYINFPGVVQNVSKELTLSSTNVKTRNFLWNSSINFTFPKNKLLSFPAYDDLLSPVTSALEVGQPLNSFYTLKFSGVDPLTGRFVSEDANGNPTVNTNNGGDFRVGLDKKVLQNLYPTLMGGMQQSFSYGNFNASFSFSFKKQLIARYLGVSVNNYPGTLSNNNNITTAFLELKRWQNPGDIATMAKIVNGLIPPGNYLNSDANYVDGSYIRLQNVALSWQLPESWASKIRMKSCSISLQAQNLATITGYSGLDPESGPTALPPVRTIVAGLQARF